MMHTSLGSDQWQLAMPWQMTRFTYHPTPDSAAVVPTGDRLDLQPQISFPWVKSFGFLTPTIKMDIAREQILDQLSGYQADPARVIPLFELRGGLYFDRAMTYLNHAYNQTVAPEFSYLYVPYHEQSSFPLFDTSNNTLSFDQLFSDNRFSGLDRIGDTHQISGIMKTQFMDKITGDEKLTAGIGQTFYFKDRQVTLCNTPGCIDSGILSNTSRTSPIYTNASYHVSADWEASANAAWLYDSSTILTRGFNLKYHPDYRHLFNLGYSFNRDTFPFSIGGDNVQRIDQTQGASPELGVASLLWPLPWLPQWSLLGYVNYDIQNRHALGSFWGLEYNSCCWALRIVSDREFMYNSYPTGEHIYDNKFYFQFVLKGLGNVGVHSSAKILDRIENYRDPYEMNFS